VSLLRRVVERLRGHAIDCALIGAEALAARGVSRATLDRDLLVTDLRVLDPLFWRPLSEAGTTFEVRRGDADDPLAGVVRIEAPGERPIDLIVGRHAWQTRILERAETIDLGDLLLAVPRTADLVLLKLYAGGAQDAWDVAQLLAGGARDALVDEVDLRLVELPVDARRLWESLRRG
jgi:hypothetical protein